MSDVALGAKGRLVLSAVAICLGLQGTLFQVLRASPAILAGTLEAAVGLSATQLGALSSALFLGYVVSILPGSVLVDRAGPRAVLVACGLLLAVGAGWFAVATSFGGLTASRFVMGLGSGALTTSILAAVNARAHGRNFAGMAGEELFIARLGGVLATGPLALGIAHFGWRPTMSGLAALALAGAALAWLLAGPHDRKPAAISLRSDIARLFGDPVMRAVLVLQAATGGASFTVIGLWGAPWTASDFGYDLTRQGVALMGMALALAVGAAASGPVTRAAGGFTRPVMAATAIAAALLALAATGLLAPGTVELWFVALGLALSTGPIVIALAKERLPPTLTARTVAMLGLAFMAGAFAGQALSGPLIDAYTIQPGHHPPAAFHILFAGLAGLLALALANFACAVLRDTAFGGGPGPAGSGK